MIIGEKILRDMYPNLDEKQYQPNSIDLKLEKSQKVRYLVLRENLTYSQRVERFDVYVKTLTGRWKKIEDCKLIGNKRIVLVGEETTEVRIFVRQSRSNPHFRHIALY